MKMNLLAMVGYEVDGRFCVRVMFNAVKVKNSVRFILSLFPKYSAGCVEREREREREKGKSRKVSLSSSGFHFPTASLHRLTIR